MLVLGHVGAAGREGWILHLEKLVEIGQTSLGVGNKKAQCLFGQFRYGQAFAVFADGTEPAIEPDGQRCLGRCFRLMGLFGAVG